MFTTCAKLFWENDKKSGNYQLCTGVMGINQDILRLTYSPVSLSKDRLKVTHTPCPGFVLGDENMQHGHKEQADST